MKRVHQIGVKCSARATPLRRQPATARPLEVKINSANYALSDTASSLRAVNGSTTVAFANVRPSGNLLSPEARTYGNRVVFILDECIRDGDSLAAVAPTGGTACA